ncbi:hypothetical protein pEaSNUABM42_00055 [Erwinia phage pEa_SNUABM_42]|nr:putative baseplate hub assembly protein [Erwinia phage pEa_SNUABM_43]QVW55372.1 hypothetical protein pEaSNUABM42_00055 [Erwinia phage pEa_SNUABM_42]
MSNDPRPTFGAAEPETAEVRLPPRETLMGKSAEEVAFELVKLNPTFSFAEATERAKELVVLNAPVEDTPPPVVDTQPAVLDQPMVREATPENLAALQSTENQLEQPVKLDLSPVQPAAAEPEPQAAVQPRVEHIAEAPPIVQPLGVQTPKPEFVPVKAEVIPAPALDVEDPPADRDEKTPNLSKEKRRQIDFGPEAHRAEITSMDPEDPHRVLTQSDELVGTTLPLAGEQEVMQFFASIPRNREGRPMFRSAAEEERYQKLFTALELTPPIMINNRAAFDMALEREDTAWQQTIKLPNGKYVSAVTDRGANAQGAMAALRRRRGSGSPVSVWLPATGIFVGFRAPHENDMCDFDIRITSEQSKIGMFTYGLLLASSSGVYLQHMIEHSLNFAVDTTYDCQGLDIKTALMDIVDVDDYWLLVIGPLMAKFPAGIPWKLLCPNHECGHEREVRLNLARCIRMADGLFSDLHRSLWLRQRGKGPDAIIGNAEYLEYRKELPKSKAARFNYEQLGITVEFGRSTIGQFIDNTNAWVEKINTSATNALANHATESERSQYIRLAAENRRLTRYATHVKAIIVEETVKGESVETREEDPDRIFEMLEELSSDRMYVLAFENALSTYNEESRMAVFGYMGHACPSCKTGEGEEDGPFRGIVTISPDKVFFALSRVVFEIQRVYLQQFENIG